MKNLANSVLRAAIIATSNNIQPGPGSSAFAQRRKLSAEESRKAAIEARKAEMEKAKSKAVGIK